MRWKACAWMQAVVGALWFIHGRPKDIFTGEYTEVVLSTSDVGVTYQNNSAGPAAGTDAFNIFDGYVRFASGTGNSLEVIPEPAALALLGLGATALPRLHPARCSSTVSPGRHPRNLKNM